MGEDVSEKSDYTPGVFTVERLVRGKWVCDDCETLIQAPVPAQVIDKGIPTAGLLIHVMIAKFADHLPLYRQESIFDRAGLAIPRSTLAHCVWGSVTALTWPDFSMRMAKSLALPWQRFVSVQMLIHPWHWAWGFR